MTLIECPECGREVSDQAEACPDCAFPISAEQDLSQGGSEEVQTIEATGKSYKAQMALGVAGMVLGVIVLVAGAANESTGASIFGATIAGTGLLAYLSGRASAWWEHE